MVLYRYAQTLIAEYIDIDKDSATPEQNKKHEEANSWYHRRVIVEVRVLM